MRCRKSTSRARSAKVSPGSWPPRTRAVGEGHPVELRSAFGFIEERAKASVPPLAGIREAVQREWLNAYRIEAEEKLYSTLRDRYQVVVETPAKPAASETVR